MSPRRVATVSLNELTADYYRLRAQAERALALSAKLPAGKDQRLAMAAEFEALCLESLPPNLDDAMLEAEDPLSVDGRAYITAKAA